MNKKTGEDTELHKLSIQTKNTNEGESSIKVMEEPIRPTRHPSIISPSVTLPSLPERRKSEKSHTKQDFLTLKVATSETKSQVSTNANPSSTKITYSNEVKEGSKSIERSPDNSSPRQKRAVSKIPKININSAQKSQMKQTHLNRKLESLKNKNDLYSYCNWSTGGDSTISPNGKSTKNVDFNRNPNGVGHIYGDSSQLPSKNQASRRGVSDIPHSGIQSRPCPHHSFLTDAQDVRQIEQGLLQLMEDFQTGNLRAFGKDSRLRQMEEIREQQEKLAKMHFDVGAEQNLLKPLSEDGLRASEENMRLLMENLAHLSIHIENLDTNAHPEKDRSTRNSCETGFATTMVDGHKENKPPNKPARKSLTSPPIIESSLHNTTGHNKNESLPPSHSPPQLRKPS